MYLRKRITPLSEDAFWRRALIQPPFEEGASMRKQNHSIPPALKPDSRLINSAVRNRKCKRSNALKHGLFTDAVLIPGEDSREFLELFDELMDEWKPAGPTHRNEVVGLVDLRWKQRRFRKFIQTKLIAAMFDPRCPPFDEHWGLLSFTHYLRTEPETCFEQHANRYLRADKINYLKQKFPRPNYQSTTEWAEAVIKEIYLLSLQAVPQSETPEIAELDDKFKEAAREWKAECQVAGTITLTSELLEYELKQGELLEARIARKIKFLVELKTMEQMLGKS
jgi:hypothetical protein